MVRQKKKRNKVGYLQIVGQMLQIPGNHVSVILNRKTDPRYNDAVEALKIVDNTINAMIENYIYEHGNQ